MMPEYAMGFWQCKLRYQTQEELLEVAREDVYKRQVRWNDSGKLQKNAGQYREYQQIIKIFWMDSIYYHGSWKNAVSYTHLLHL